MLLAVWLPTGCNLTERPDLNAGGRVGARYAPQLSKAQNQLLATARRQMADGQSCQAAATLRQLVESNPLHLVVEAAYQDAAQACGGDVELGMRERLTRMRDDGAAALPFLRSRLANSEAATKDLLDEALRRDTSFYPALVSLAQLRRRVGQPRVALRLLQRALSLAPNHAAARRAISDVYIELDEPKSAEPHLRRFVQNTGGDFDSKLTLARLLLYHMHKADDAARLIEPLAKERADDLDLSMDLAAIAWLRGDFVAASHLYLKVLRKQPNNARAALNLGDMFFDGMGRDAANRAVAWERARLAYLYFLSLDNEEESVVILNRVTGVPLRLRQIDKLLGPRVTPDKPVRVEDI